MLASSCPKFLTKLVMSDSAAGSSAKTSSVSPTFISSSSSLALKTGSGQYNPIQSSVLSGLDFMFFPQLLERKMNTKKRFRKMTNCRNVRKQKTTASVSKERQALHKGLKLFETRVL